VPAKLINGVFVLFLLGGLPVLGVRTMRQADPSIIPRRALYFSAALSQWLLVALTFIIALTSPAAFAKFHPINPAQFGKWAVALLLISLSGIGAVLILEKGGWWPEESKWVYALVPRTTREKLWALALLAPTAGFCEEFVYRGYLLTQLFGYLHSVAGAWIISSLAFGLAHAYQKPSGVARAALLGALLAWPVVRLGSIYPSMAAHFLIDAIALVWLAPATLKRESG
jgi:uncharacterized protein